MLVLSAVLNVSCGAQPPLFPRERLCKCRGESFPLPRPLPPLPPPSAAPARHPTHTHKVQRGPGHDLDLDTSLPATNVNNYLDYIFASSSPADVSVVPCIYHLDPRV